MRHHVAWWEKFNTASLPLPIGNFNCLFFDFDPRSNAYETHSITLSHTGSEDSYFISLGSEPNKEVTAIASRSSYPKTYAVSCPEKNCPYQIFVRAIKDAHLKEKDQLLIELSVPNTEIAESINHPVLASQVLDNFIIVSSGFCNLPQDSFYTTQTSTSLPWPNSTLSRLSPMFKPLVQAQGSKQHDESEEVNLETSQMELDKSIPSQPIGSSSSRHKVLPVEIEALKKAADSGDSTSNAIFQLWEHVTESLQQASLLETFADLQKVAETYRSQLEGHHLNALGLMYQYEYVTDLGKLDRREKARICYEDAVAKGDTNGIFNLGLLFLERGDFKRALTQFEQASEKGHALAHSNAAALYFNGDGLGLKGRNKRDYVKSRQHYEAASNAGNMDAQWEFAQMLESGDGRTNLQPEAIKKDYQNAQMLLSQLLKNPKFEKRKDAMSILAKVEERLAQGTNPVQARSLKRNKIVISSSSELEDSDNFDSDYSSEFSDKKPQKKARRHSESNILTSRRLRPSVSSATLVLDAEVSSEPILNLMKALLESSPNHQQINTLISNVFNGKQVPPLNTLLNGQSILHIAARTLNPELVLALDSWTHEHSIVLTVPTESTLSPERQKILAQTIDLITAGVNQADQDGNTPLHLLFHNFLEMNAFTPDSRLEQVGKLLDTFGIGLRLVRAKRFDSSAVNLFALNQKNQTPLHFFFGSNFVPTFYPGIIQQLFRANYGIQLQIQDKLKQTSLQTDLIQLLKESKLRFIAKCPEKIKNDEKALKVFNESIPQFDEAAIMFSNFFKDTKIPDVQTTHPDQELSEL